MEQTINLSPDKKMLRHFGLIMAGMVSGLFGLLLPFLFGKDFPTWPWYVAISFAIPAALFPQILKHIYILWMRFGLVAGKINSKIILTIFYFLIITPVALAMRIAGRDRLKKTLDEKEKTYRIDCSNRNPSQTMDKPF